MSAASDANQLYSLYGWLKKSSAVVCALPTKMLACDVRNILRSLHTGEGLWLQCV